VRVKSASDTRWARATVSARLWLGGDRSGDVPFVPLGAMIRLRPTRRFIRRGPRETAQSPSKLKVSPVTPLEALPDHARSHVAAIVKVVG